MAPEVYRLIVTKAEVVAKASAARTVVSLSGAELVWRNRDCLDATVAEPTGKPELRLSSEQGL